MKNNAIFFFVDSVTWNSIGTNQAKVSPTPFLDSLKAESITTTKLYSHGPYTDAATHSLFTGRDCLDDFGYFFKLNTAPINHYKVFHDAGYETYDFNYPFYIIGDDVAQYIDHAIYSNGFIYGSEWGGIYAYYHDIIKERPLDDDEHILLKARVAVMFESWKRYLQDALAKPEAMMHHKEILKTYDAKAALDILVAEETKFNQDSIAYIDDFIAQGQNHVLVNLDNSGIETYIDNEFLDNYIEKKYGKFLDKIARNNFLANVWNNMPSFKRLLFGFRRYIKTHNSDNLLFIQNYLGCLTTIRLMRKRWKRQGWQNQHTAHTIYQSGLQLLKERKSDKPFYIFFDVEEPHNNIAFFSYDTQDKEVIDEEMTMLKQYVDELGTDFKGNLLYLLSLRYSDYQLQKCCEELKRMGLWDTTTILVVADHGSSYTFHPIHNRRVNCFDDECYHIPMLIRYPGGKGIEITTYQYSKDVLPTLMDVLGLEPCKEFKGRSMLRETEPRPYVISEYMGPGCPDMLKRKIWFSVRDEKYLIAYKVGVYEDFDDGELAEVYDLTKDPDGFYNINDQIDSQRIDYLLRPLRERQLEIRRDTTTFMNSLKNKYSDG
jgi:hypothetical protein